MNKIDKEKSQNSLQLANFQAELSANTIAELSDWITTKCTLRADIANPAGGTFSSQELQDQLSSLASKNYAGTRFIQQRASEGLQIALGTQDQLKLIIPLPNFGNTEAIDTTSLKTIDDFTGDDDLEKENDNLRKFLRSIYSVCRGKTTQEACRSALLRKLSGTSQKLVDRLFLHHTNIESGEIEEGRPTLTEIAYCL